MESRELLGAEHDIGRFDGIRKALALMKILGIYYIQIRPEPSDGPAANQREERT